MRILLTRGEKAAALVTYRRCREALSIVLGIAPAAETETLHRRALAA
jgi:DNA-binding SARP family transcriptional activator